jgi:hypothetical protein
MIKRGAAESLLLTCAIPLKQIPLLIEWWLTIRTDNTNFRFAEITAIESIDIEDSANPFAMHSLVLLDDMEAIPPMIISANKKTGTIVHYPEDANGDPVFDPLTQKAVRKTIYRHDISIYHCIGFLEKGFQELPKDIVP